MKVAHGGTNESLTVLLIVSVRRPQAGFVTLDSTRDDGSADTPRGDGSRGRTLGVYMTCLCVIYG